jgi:hypothetical protein
MRKMSEKKRMTLKEWENLTEEQQDSVQENLLPEIPREELQNGLTASRMILKNGERYWEITLMSTEGKEITKQYAEYKQKDISGTLMWYKFDPVWGTYKMNLTGTEPSMDEEPIGHYGTEWLEFMKEHHPHLVGEMRMKHNLLTVARAVDERAWEYRELLDRQYAQTYPRPMNYEDVVKWEKTRMFHTDSAVMREKVLVAVTQP